jgi:membrane protein implicated in regulation of membrane protease activity
VSAAFAIYAVLVPLVTAAGAAAIVSAVAALIVAIAGMIAARKVEGRHHHHGQQAPPQSFDMTGKIVEIVRDKPLMSIGIGLAAGIFALKNPTLTASLAKAFLDPKPPQR